MNALFPKKLDLDDAAGPPFLPNGDPGLSAIARCAEPLERPVPGGKRTLGRTSQKLSNHLFKRLRLRLTWPMVDAQLLIA